MKKVITLVLVLAIGLFASVGFSEDIALTWIPSDAPDLSHYRLFRAEMFGDVSDAWQLIADNILTAAYTDVVEDHKNFIWYVTAVDLAGNEADPSSVYVWRDKTPPGQLKGLAGQKQ